MDRYERPWRKAMAKGARSIDHDRSHMGPASEVLPSPRPYQDIKSTRISEARHTPITAERYKGNRDYRIKRGLYSEKPSMGNRSSIEAVTDISLGPAKTNPKFQNK